MSGGVPKRVQISRIQRNTPSKAGNVVAKKALVLCSGRRSRRAMCNYIKQRAKTCATCPPPSSDLEYNIVYEPQNIILPSQAAILVTSSSQPTITLTVQYITRNGQTVWRPNDAISILKKVEFNMQQTDSNTNLIDHKMFVNNGSNKKLASFNVNTGAITFIPGDFPHATKQYGNSTGFDIRLTIKFVDQTKNKALTTITKIGSIKVTTRVNAPSPPAGQGLSFNVIYNNSLKGASLTDLLNSSTGAVLSSGQSISFLELIGTGTQAAGKFELAPNFVQVGNVEKDYGGTAISGPCYTPYQLGTQEVPDASFNANFPVAQKLLNEATAYFIDPSIIKKGASFSGHKNNGGNIWNNNFDYGNPAFAIYFAHATGATPVTGWPVWSDGVTTQYLGNVNELEFIYSPTEYNQALVTKPSNTSILEKPLVNFCVPAPTNNTGHSTNKDYIWSNAVPPEYPNDPSPSYMGLYGLKEAMGASFASLDIYFAGGESHASNGQFASEVTYSAIQNYEINTTGYCSKCGASGDLGCGFTGTSPCPQAQPQSALLEGKDFGAWQISRIGHAGNVPSLDLETFAHEVAHQIFYKDEPTPHPSNKCSDDFPNWLKNLKNAGGKTIPVIGVGGGNPGSIDVSFHSKLIPYLLYEMDAIFNDTQAGYGVKPEKVALYHASANFIPCQ